MNQQAYKLDKASLIKILKGGCIAATATFALFVLDAVGTIEVNNLMLAGFLTWFTPFAINFIKEWKKGEIEKTEPEKPEE